MIYLAPAGSGVLIIADRLEPSHVFAIDGFGHGNVRHAAVRGRAVPVLFTRREEHRIAGIDRLDRTTVALDPTLAGGNDDRLAGGMRVPDRLAPGEKVTAAVPARAGASGMVALSTRTVPVKLSGTAPGLEGASALRVIFMSLGSILFEPGGAPAAVPGHATSRRELQAPACSNTFFTIGSAVMAGGQPA